MDHDRKLYFMVAAWDPEVCNIWTQLGFEVIMIRLWVIYNSLEIFNFKKFDCERP